LLVEQPCQQAQSLFELAGANPLLKPAMAGLERRILLGQLAPLRPRAKNPQNPVQHGPRVVPRPPTVVVST